jgi:hypothetical protein
MLERFRATRPSHGTVVAYLALFVALSGSAYAAATIGSGQIKNGAVLGRHIKDGQVKGADIAPNALSSSKIPDNSLAGNDIDESKLGRVPLAALADLATNSGHATNADLASNASHANSADSAGDASHATNSDQLGGLGPSSFFPSGNVRKLDVTRTGCSSFCLNELDLGTFKLQTTCLAASMGNTARLDVSTTVTGPNPRVDWFVTVIPNAGAATTTSGQNAGGALFSVPAANASSAKFSATIVYRDDASVVTNTITGNVVHNSSFNVSCQVDGTATKATG